MANERLIKQRIRSAKNISQITKAMQMVSASKMRKAQAAALMGRPYAEKIAEMVREFTSRIDANKHPLLAKNAIGKRLIVLISTNKGLLGGLNTTLFRELTQRFSQEELHESVFVSVGKKGESFLVRSSRQLSADFSETEPFNMSIPALNEFITKGYLNKEFKEVYLFYNNFISALKQEPTAKKILPVTEFSTTTVKDAPEEEHKELEFLIEPAIEKILDPLLVSFLENQIRDSIYEAEASEHSARMIAMKNATDNANDFVDLLTLEFNKARQEKITYEIADMITARSAFE